MAGTNFILKEVRAKAGTISEIPDGESFEWSHSRTAPTSRGGGRAAPVGAWKSGGTLRNVATIYPGSKTKSQQVISASQKEFTFSGEWNDRYNAKGYAVAERRRFEDMCRRGNLVRVQYDTEVFIGLIVDWDLSYKNANLISYAFAIDPADREEHFGQKDTNPKTVKSATQSFDDVNTKTQALLSAQTEAPTPSMIGELQGKVELATKNLNDVRNKLSGSIDQREVSPILKPVSEFKRLATQFRAVKGSASGIMDDLLSVRSDLDVGVTTALSVLDFESWSRSMRFRSRLLVSTSDGAANDSEERAEPDIIAIYRAHKGESLYNISRRFYGTPFGWRNIADRNNLRTLALDGSEVLVIPERGAA